MIELLIAIGIVFVVAALVVTRLSLLLARARHELVEAREVIRLLKKERRYR